jgi:hypothetical protein
MVEPFTFEPEVIKPSTPWEKVQHGRQRARDLYKHLQKAVGGFSFAKFMSDFASPLVENYNVDAKKLGLPLANKAWFKVLRNADGGALAPKDFFVKHRTILQPRLYPGDPIKATKSYNLLLNKMSALPRITSGPISGELAHEFGHIKTDYGDPSVPTAAFGPMDKSKEFRPVVENAVNEAVASYQGFQTAWKTWGKFGIPKKAWGAWFGFPTYTDNMTEAQLGEVLKRIKSIEGKYPGIEDQVRKALYEYHKYIEPVMYNVPGGDWTPTEKKALERFLKSRGGTYRETLPEDEKKRLRHMRSQPYVKAPTTTQPTSVMATFVPPLSKRAWPPLSCRKEEE